jgi:hypothetical protein
LWAFNENQMVTVEGPGVIYITVWRQQSSLTVHLVNLTNPMMMKGPFRELIPVDLRVSIQVPGGIKVKDVKLLVKGENPKFEISNGKVVLDVPQVSDHEIVALEMS